MPVHHKLLSSVWICLVNYVLFGIFQSSVLALEESALDVDQVENLVKFCPTKEEMELLKVSDDRDKIIY